jgi:YD repeat-containing protein
MRYGEGNNILKPTTIYQAKAGTDTPLFDYRIHTRYQYNVKSNTIEKDQLGIKETFLWSYNGLYPVIHINGAGLDEVRGMINSNGLSSYVDGNFITQDTNIEYVAGKLREAFSGTASQVDSYTYQPLVGMTSATDPHGLKTTYEYDSAGRLKYVKDANGKILKSYEYHYKN